VLLRHRSLAAALVLGVASALAAAGRAEGAPPGRGKGGPAARAAEPRSAEKAGKNEGKPGKGGKDGGKGKKKRKRGSLAARETIKHLPSLSLLKKAIRCPEDMVAVAGRVCVDRYEATLVESSTEELLSPFYPPSPRLVLWSLDKWTAAREEAPEGSMASTLTLPAVPAFEREPFQMKAMSWPGSTPSGYLTGDLAAQACRGAGKRLCSEAEWVTACRGEKQTKYPYGPTYQHGVCNVFREDHPSAMLHGDASSHHSDPRLNLLETDAGPLLRPTGQTERCASVWGDDAIYDMVGNLDEWVEDPGGTFVGGFFSRATRSGCDARVSTHPYSYFDYSLGVRCCQDPLP
jgi:hypothetical protein